MSAIIEAKKQQVDTIAEQLKNSVSTVESSVVFSLFRTKNSSILLQSPGGKTQFRQ